MPGADLEQQIAALRKQAADAQAARGKAEHQRELAAAKLREVQDALQKEFGVTPEQASARLAELEHDLAQEAARIRAELAQVTGAAAFYGTIILTFAFLITAFIRDYVAAGVHLK